VRAVSDKLKEILSKLQAEKQTRAFLKLDRKSINKENRTVDLSFSSELPGERWFGMEILDHSKDACDLTRLNNGGALLVNHNPDDQVGVIETAQIDGDRRGKAVVKFSQSIRGQEIFQDIQDGIRGLVSVGYEINEIVREKVEGKLETYRVTRWTPLEISIVSIPLDPTVGVGRNHNKNDENSMRILLDPAPSPGGGGPAPVAPTVNVQEIENRGAQAQLTRVKEIRALAKAHNQVELGDQFIDEGTTVEAFKDAVLKRMGAVPLNEQESKPGIGLTEKEKRSYSVCRAIVAAASGKLTGFEKECSDEVEKRVRRSPSGDKGFFIPWDVAGSPIKRSLNATTATAGGFTVGTDVQGASMIELLRNKMVFNQLGARSLSGLVGNVAIPRHAGGATTYWLAEGASVTASQQTFGQLALTPKRLSALTAYDKQLLIQSSIDVEGFVREDLMTVLALEKDRACINGLGAAGEPLGIINTTGIGAVTFGAAATWAKVVEFESTTETANALMGAIAYLTTPATKGKWKTASKVANQAIFLWEGNTVNGYRAESTKQVPSDKVIFGNFADFIVADWDGIDVVVDPYTLAANAQIRIIINIMTDNGIRHAASFTVSSDSGAQ
jgi:HK97 family phage major capsid protein